MNYLKMLMMRPSGTSKLLRTNATFRKRMKDFHVTPKIKSCLLMHFKLEAKTFEILARNWQEWPAIK